MLERVEMPKITTGQIKNAADAVYAAWVASLGLKAAGRAQRLLGRLLREEKSRRETKPDGGNVHALRSCSPR
jgi:hypothetical protein